MNVNIGLLSIGFGPFRTDIAEKYLNQTSQYIKDKNFDVFSYDKVITEDEDFFQTIDDFKKKDLDLLIIQLGTFSKGEWMVRLIQEFHHVPFLLWGFNDPVVEDFTTVPMNSLTSINMFTSFLYQMDKKFTYIYDTFNVGEDFIKLEQELKVIEVKKKLKNAKFLVVGSRVPGFYLSGADELRLRKDIGVEIEYYSIATLLKEAQNVSEEEVQANFKALNVKIEDTISIETVKKSIRVEIVLLKYAKEHRINGIAFKCWPEIQDLYDISACGILSTLIDAGIMASCESDITGLTTMYILNLITNEPIFFGDMVGKAKHGRIKLWHCGLGPKTLAKSGCQVSYTHQPVMKNGIGVGVQYLMKTGQVSLCKLSQGKKGFRMFCALGESHDPDRELEGVQTDIQLKSDFNKVLDVVFTEGIEHHFALVHRDVKEILRALAKELNIEFIDVEER